MSHIWDWVRTITLVVILFSFVEILLPGGTMRKYLKFIFSLAVLAMILSPFTSLTGQEISVSGNAPVSQALRDLESQSREGEREAAISKVQTKQIETVYLEKLTAKLSEELKEKFSGITVTSVEIYINNEVRSSGFGKPEKASASISDPDFEKPVRDFIADRLQIEKRSVSIMLPEE